MKALPALFLAVAALLGSALPARADEAPALGRPPRQAQSSGSRAPVKGLQLATGLQTANPLQLASFGSRLSDEEWRKLFPIKEPQR